MMHKLTKIVATVSDDGVTPEFITKLYKSGMNCVRLNTAHQSFEGSMKVIKAVRAVSDKIAILVDTKGPEVRTSEVKEPIPLKKGAKITVTYGTIFSTTDTMYVSFKHFVRDVPVHSSILIDDGETELKVLSKTKKGLVCRVENEGILKSRKSINVPGVSLKLPALTDKDKDYLEFAVKNKLDFIAHSFVRNKSDLKQIQTILDSYKSKIKIISKIENKEGVENIDEILDHCAGVMVARGDLAIEIPAQDVPIVQKRLIKKCREKHKVVITATQMLHSMIDNPRPTRAEVSDVANAIYDGTDCVMLSGETAYGKYPIEAVQMMSSIAKKVESSSEFVRPKFLQNKQLSLSEIRSQVRNFLCTSAIFALNDLPVKAIMIHTISGETARFMSSYRPKKPIFVKSHDKHIVRELALTYGVYAYDMPKLPHIEELMKDGLKEVINEERLSKDDLVVLVGASGDAADFMEIVQVKDFM